MDTQIWKEFQGSALMPWEQFVHEFYVGIIPNTKRVDILYVNGNAVVGISTMRLKDPKNMRALSAGQSILESLSDPTLMDSAILYSFGFSTRDSNLTIPESVTQTRLYQAVVKRLGPIEYFNEVPSMYVGDGKNHTSCPSQIDQTEFQDLAQRIDAFDYWCMRHVGNRDFSYLGNSLLRNLIGLSRHVVQE